MAARPLWPYYSNGAKSDRQSWKSSIFLDACFEPERDKIVVFMWRTDEGIEKPCFWQFFGNRNFNAFFDEFPEGGQFFPIWIMSTIFTNQTPWITLADAFGVFFRKNHDFFSQKMSISCWVSSLQVSHFFGPKLWAPVITSCTPWISLADALGVFFTKTRKFWIAVYDVLCVLLTKKGWSPFAE